MFTPRDSYLIELPPDRSQAAYFPGEIIRGRVYIRWDPSFPVPTFQLQLRGQAKVVIHRYKRVLTQRELILKTRQAVRNLRRPSQHPMLPPNTSVYEFEFLLPPDLPPSFTSPMGKKGRVKYRLEVMKAEPYYDHIYHGIAITVKPLQPLAGNLVAKLSVLQEQKRARHYFCCGADRYITVNALLLKVGVDTGEVIPFHAVITNHSQNYVKSSHITMIRRWMWYSIGETNKGSERVRSFKKVSRGAIPPGGTMRWGENDEPIVLPKDLIPSGPSGCSIIKLAYELVFTVVPQGMVRNIKLRLPIIVGTDLSPEMRASMERNTAASAASIRGSVLLHLLRNAVTARPEVEREVTPEENRVGLHEMSPLHT